MDRRRAAGTLLALAACVAFATAAPTAGNHTSLDLYDGAPDGCYYNFQHYGEGDRIMTNEPCLNCTCHNRMLMCYLRVCPFTKPIGQDCTIEKRADQCCPIVTCPDVPVDLLTSTTTSPAEYGSTGMGKLDKFGCSIDGKYFSEGSKVPPTPNKPCEHCYCIRNMTTCVMQECTLHVDGCTPIYHKDVCCPVRYSCDHPEDEMPLLDDMSTTVRPTPGFLLTTTTLSPVTQISQDCVYDNQIFPDGALIKTEKACDHCYCMKGDIVCVVQECGTPMENEGKNCTALPPREGVCCPDTYICEGDEPTTGTFDDSVTTTEMPQESILTLSPPRKTSEGRYEDKVPTELPFPEPEVEGSGDQVTEGISQSSTAEDTEEPHEYISVTPKVPEQIPEDIISSPAIQPATEKYDDQDLGSGEEDIETKDKEETSSEASPNIERTESSTPSDDQKIKPTSEPESEISHSDETSVPSILENEQTSPHEKEYFTTEQYGEPSVTKVSTEVKESATTDSSPQTTPSSEDIAEKTTTTESSDSNILPTIAEESLEKEPIQPESHSSSTTVTSNVDDEISTESPESVTESVENTDMNPQTPNVVTSSTPQLEEIEEETTELKDQKPTTVDDLIPSTPSASPLPVDTDDKQVETEIPEEFSTEHIPTPSPTLPSDLVTTLPESDIKESDEDHATDMDQYEPTTKGPIDDIEKKTTQSDITSVAEESSAQTTEEPDKGLNTIPSGSVDEEPSITEQSIDQTETTKKPTMADEKDIETTSEPIHDDLRTESPTEPKSTVPEQYETSSQSPSLDEVKATSPTLTSEIEPTASVDQGTESAEDVKETETEKEVVEPIEATSESAYVPTNAPEKESSAEVTETTTANQEENEIINESRIPGEGDCLVNGVTYQNESSVPSTNKCQTGCKCVSSILKCEPIICSEPLESMDNCRTVYDSPDSCCPTYICDQNTETLPPQSHNQMSGTDKPTITPAVECHGDECAIVEPSKETQESCTSEGCTNKSESSPEITKPQEEIIKPCNSETGCQSVPVADCKGQDCQPSDEVLPQRETIKPCNSETGCQSVPVADCKGQDCQPSDEVLPQEETIKPCNSETGCQSIPVADCNGQDCQPSDNVPPAETQPCNGESCNIPTEVVDDRKDSCQDGEKCELPQSIPEKCIGESCRRKEPSGLDSEKPSEETSGKPIEDDLETKMPLETTTSSSLHDLTTAPERLPEEPESPATATIEKSEVVTKSPDSEQHEDGQKSEDGQKPDDESTTETLSTITEPSDLDTRFESIPTKPEESSSDVPKVTETTANEEVVTEVAEQTTEPTVPLVTDNESDQSIPSEDDTTKYNEPEQDHTTLSTLNDEATTKKAEIEDTEIVTKSPIADEIETKQPEEASNEPSVTEQDSQAVTDEVSETTSKTTDEEAESTSDKDLASATELPETSISETYETTPVIAKDESNIEAEKEEEEKQTLSSMLPIEDETVTAGPAAEPTEKSPSSDEKPEDEKLTESVKPTTPAETDKPSDDKLEESSDTPAIPEIVTEEPAQSSDTEPMATTSKQDNEPETATEAIETTNVPTSETDSSKTQDDVTPDSSSITTESSVDNKQQSETTLAPITDSVEPITATSPTLVEKPIENADDSLRTTVIPESIEDATSKKPEEDLSESSVTTETSSDENEPTTPKSEKIPEINEPEPETEQETTVPDTEQKKETLSPVSDGLSTEPSKTDMRDNEPEIPESPELVTIGPEIVDDEMKVTESPTVDSDATTQSAVDKPLPTEGDEKVEPETATEQNEVTDKTSPQSEEDLSTEPIKTIPETKPSEEDADISTKEPMDTDENVETSKPDDEDSQQVDKEQTTTPISQKDEVSEDTTTKSSDILDKEPETGGTTTRIDEIEDSKVPTESSEPTSAQDYEPERGTTPAPSEPHAPTETVEIQTPVSEIIDTPTRDSEKEPEKEVTSSDETSKETTESAVEPTQSSDEQKPESDSTEKDLSVTEGSDSQESTTSANVNKIEATVSEPTATESIQNQPEETVTVPKEVESTVTKSPEEETQIPTETDEAQPETHITDGPVTEPVEIDEVATEVNVIQQKTTAAESDVELTTKSPIPDFEDHRRTYNPVELSTETSITNTVESESVTTPRVENQVTEEPEKIQPTESELESIPEKSSSSPVMDVVEDISTMMPETKPSENVEPSSEKPVETENLTEQPIQSVTSETDIMEPMGTKQPVDQAEMQTTQPPIIEEETSTKVDKYEQPDVTSEKEPIEDERVTVAPTTEALEDITSEPKPVTSQENIEDTSESKTSTASPLVTEAEKIEPSDEVTLPEQVITQAPEIKYSENIENVPTSTDEHSITAEVTESSQILTTESQKEKDETATEVPEKVTAIISDVTETSTEPSEGTSPKQQDEPIAPQEEPTSEDHKPLDVESTEKPVDELTPATEVPVITPDSVQEPESPQKETELPIKESTTDNVDETTVSRVEHPSTSSFAEEEPEKTTQAIVSETTATPAVVPETTAAPAVVSETTAAPLDTENVTAEQPEIATEKDIRTSPQQPEMVTERDITTAQEEVSVPQVTEQVPVVTEKPLEDTITEEAILTTPKMTSTKAEEESSTAKPTEKATEPTPVQTTEAPKPSEPEDVPTPEEEPSFPPSGTSGYGEPDYIEEDQTFGPGTCRYGGKVYVSAQQIPRDDPCDFCFCFRSDIICLQQSCPPPIHGCHEEPIQGFCCPRYECPVSMATTVNVTTTTTTTTTTLPPHFPIHSYKGSAQRKGCLIKGQSYKVGDVVRSSSGPCLHCTCGGDGQMKCDPKVCTPEPMLRQMIAAAVASKRRR